MEIKVLKNIMERNASQAADNRVLFDNHGILAVNIMSSPGAGKTTILEKTIDELKDRFAIAVIEGDLMTSKDAERIHAHGVPVVQINTEGGCHLTADMVAAAIRELPIESLDIIFIENVGNLVCPSSFDLGEHFRIVVSSVPEGDDKPLKYPTMFQEAKACLLNKTDLLAYTNFNIDNFFKDVTLLNPKAVTFQISAFMGEGIEQWNKWLESQYEENKQRVQER